MVHAEVHCRYACEGGDAEFACGYGSQYLERRQSGGRVWTVWQMDRRIGAVGGHSILRPHELDCGHVRKDGRGKGEDLLSRRSYAHEPRGRGLERLTRCEGVKVVEGNPAQSRPVRQRSAGTVI